ncbi:hypothetical protein [Magnetofaba australis]|uniref:hypothetical protein n=1 Tax=Magnetofaba australis TaxID=1472297 RepID=UPI000A19EDB1|nr:hypothetical protein [Magnetofaba australis]
MISDERHDLFGIPEHTCCMTSEELQTVGGTLYGKGLLDDVYIKALARDLNASESSVRGWWFGVNQHIPATTREFLMQLQTIRGRV